MVKIFAAAEIVQLAIRIEENGEEFYRLMAQKTRDKNIKDIFSYLADQEIKHGQTFRELLSRVEHYEPAESYPGEYFSYLRAYADEHIFTQEKKGRLVARKIKSAKEGVKFALGIERDSILYYLEAKNLVPEGQKETIGKIVEEERRHYLTLTEVKKKW